ncbi:MAG: peptidase [Bacteroidetes bacterium]|nr:MAG: peptidase [Bacteroidota bacterium]
MKNITILITTFILFIGTINAQKQTELYNKLDQLSKQYNFNFKELKTSKFFKEKYLLSVPQLINPKDSSKGFFTQRIFLSHLDFDSAVVFVTEGYAATYASYPNYVNELSPILNANQIVVEYRFFASSTPDSALFHWTYLTIENAAADHHHIIEILKNIYKNKWVNTGISKGGQTSIYHRYLYPNDVAVTVAYVAPLNFSMEEKRVYRHLGKVGTAEEREAILDYQTEMLKNKAKYIPEFEKLAKEKHQTYSMGIEKGYELTVLEYSFAFWQWGTTNFKDIPEAEVGAIKMIKHLDNVASIDWISEQGIKQMQPFFYQAITQFGMYGYDITPFKEWTSYKQNPTFEFTAPKGETVKYNNSLHIKIDNWVRHYAKNMIFITGEYDPWGSTSVELSLDNNCIKFTKPKGSHRTRISNLPEPMREEAISLLKEWMK